MENEYMPAFKTNDENVKPAAFNELLSERTVLRQLLDEARDMAEYYSHEAINNHIYHATMNIDLTKKAKDWLKRFEEMKNADG